MISSEVLRFGQGHSSDVKGYSVQDEVIKPVNSCQQSLLLFLEPMPDVPGN
jgi:hypothetical protein